MVRRHLVVFSCLILALLAGAVFLIFISSAPLANAVPVAHQELTSTVTPANRDRLGTVLTPERTSTTEPLPTPTVPIPTPTATMVTPSPSTATPVPTPEPPPPAPLSAPARLRIPVLGVDTIVEHVGLTPDGRMDVPKSPNNVAWYQPGTVPGAPGNAVIAGHLDSRTGPAVFYHLQQLVPGNKIEVIGEDGSEIDFTVTEVLAVPADAAPLDRVFGPSVEEHLNLITCDGTFERQRQQYNQRLIVFTRRTSP